MNYFKSVLDSLLLRLPPPPRKKAPILAYPFPLRRDFVTTLELPADLDEQEAERLCNFIHAVVGRPWYERQK